jgi:hypothetical protein
MVAWDNRNGLVVLKGDAKHRPEMRGFAAPRQEV